MKYEVLLFFVQTSSRRRFASPKNNIFNKILNWALCIEFLCVVSNDKKKINNDNINGGETLHFQTECRLNIWFNIFLFRLLCSMFVFALSSTEWNIIAKKEQTMQCSCCHCVSSYMKLFSSCSLPKCAVDIMEAHEKSYHVVKLTQVRFINVVDAKAGRHDWYGDLHESGFESKVDIYVGIEV